MLDVITIEEEVSFLTHYLLRRRPSSKEIELYKTALSKYYKPGSRFDEKLWSFVYQDETRLYWIDSALAIFIPRHPIRQKLLLLVGILEMNPMSHRDFLPRKYSIWETLGMGLDLLKISFSIVFGSVLLGLLRVLWR